MKAITTKFHGPTRTKQSRYSATADGWGRVYVSKDFGLLEEEEHARAVEKLLRNKAKYTNHAVMVSGGVDCGTMVWVNAQSYALTFNREGAES